MYHELRSPRKFVVSIVDGMMKRSRQGWQGAIELYVKCDRFTRLHITPQHSGCSRSFLHGGRPRLLISPALLSDMTCNSTTSAISCEYAAKALFSGYLVPSRLGGTFKHVVNALQAGLRVVCVSISQAVNSPSLSTGLPSPRNSLSQAWSSIDSSLRNLPDSLSFYVPYKTTPAIVKGSTPSPHFSYSSRYILASLAFTRTVHVPP
jgi:hypothetical protein